MTDRPTHALPSYLNADDVGPWGIYLEQVERVTPYLGKLSRWVETLKRPKRTLIVDVPIELDNGTVAHFEGYVWAVAYSGPATKIDPETCQTWAYNGLVGAYTYCTEVLADGERSTSFRLARGCTRTSSISRRAG